MAAKLLRSLTDDNQDLQKQIGCMTGIFQLFDRQHMLTTRRITGHTTHTPRRGVPSGGSQFNGGTLESESNISYSRSGGAVDKHSSKHMLEKQRLSTESSRASFSSSSRSSSFSSLDYNKTTQPEPSSSDRITFPETNSGESGMMSRQTVDLREVVKDSMYREAHHGLPVKSAAVKDDTVDSLFKHRDSPRPLQFSRSNEGSSRKQDLPVDLKESSLIVLSKFQETPWYHNSEPRELSRSASYQSKEGGSFFSIAKDAPRFSYDGRDTRYASFESRDSSKSSMKFKELPRLSLDSRENSMRSFKSDSQPLLNPLQRDGGSSNHSISSQVRPPSVVAKLMGLETLPSSVSSSENVMNSGRTFSVVDSGRASKSPNTPFQMSSSSKNLWKEPNSPRWKNSDPTLKPASRFPIEPAPWKQLDGNRTSQRTAFKNMKSHSKVPNSSFPSVYSEIEKRLKDLEFSQSGKDLRALKQILEAMQAKGLLESQTGEDHQAFASQEDIERKYTNSMSGSRLVNQQKLQHDYVSLSAKRGTNFSRNFESPIVIMKPAKLVEKSGIPASSVISLDDLSSLPRVQDGVAASVDRRKSSVNGRASSRDQIPKSTMREKVPANVKNNTKTLKSSQSSTTRTSQSSKENNAGSLKSSGSISPRMQQKRQELERRSRPPIPPPDSSKPRRNSSKQGTESSSPGGRRRPKPTNLQHIDEIRNELRNLSCHENESSAQSDGSVLSESRIDFEVNSSERSPEMSSCPSPSMKPAHHLVPGFMGKKSSRGGPNEDDLLMEHPVDAPEYPSPVSVLDVAAADMNDSPSPVKHTKKALRDDESRKCDTVSSSEQCKQEENLTMEEVGSGGTTEINRKKLQNIENLVQKLRRLNSSHDEARTDYIASLCENTNPDHRYISEILLASGLLLRDLGSNLTNFQFHPSGHPINPELFLVLEQTKASSFSKEDCASAAAPAEKKQQQQQPVDVQLWSKERIQRKLIFDTINEILAKRLSFLGPSCSYSEPWMKPNKLARKTLNAQKLLRELCLETEVLQAKKSKCSSSNSSEEEDDGMKNILWEDVMHRSENWTDFNGELSSIVLDIERLIFKDLVGEIVMGEAPGLKNKQVIRRRQLFAK